MTPPPPVDSALDAFAADIQHDGEGLVLHQSPPGAWRRLTALPFSWLAFPFVAWLLSRGLLRNRQLTPALC